MWELISSDDGVASHRLAVPGGWVVRSKYSGYKMGASIAQTFVKDENHSWNLDKGGDGSKRRKRKRVREGGGGVND